jgi:outer membrane lipoprotein LolB
VRLRVLLVASLVLGGCATAPRTPPPVGDPLAAWGQRQAALRALERWQISGRVGVRSGDEQGQANVVWVRDGSRHRINLFGPFGGGRVVLTEDPGGAQLRDGKHETLEAPDARTVLYQRTGWDIPFDELQYWLTGVPAPGASNDLNLDAWGRLQTLRQDGWVVQVLEYEQEDRYELPRRLVISRAGGDAAGRGPVEVKLVIKGWGLQP